MMLACLTIALFQASACSTDSMLGPSTERLADTPGDDLAVVLTDAVGDLHVVTSAESSVSLAWTEVDDGLGRAAHYRLKYATPPIDWSEAQVGCDSTLEGSAIGAERSCTVQGLTAGTTYDFQLVSYRLASDGTWAGAAYSNVATGATEDGTPGGVDDLAVVGATESSLTLRWTQVDDGQGAAAWYRVKYAAPPIDWSAATIGCDRTLVGSAIGAPISCTITGLAPGTTYDVQLMSFRTIDGVWHDAQPSNVVQAATTASASASLGAGGIWISRAELARLPMSGPAWEDVSDEADGSCGRVDLADQEQRNNVCILAKALVFVRTGRTSLRSDVVDAIRQIVGAPRYDGRALALGRELAAYVIAADLIDLRGHDPDLDRAFRAELRELLTTYTNSGPRNLVECHEKRPNNWGTMCGASRAAVAAYLGDTDELARTARVFRGWLGERSAYAGFSYGDLSWQCDPQHPVGINPRGCQRYGRDLGGILPDDQRRGGSYTWPPPKENYVWEALQGAVVQAVILERAGYPAFEWGDRALLRAVTWLHQVIGYRAQGDDVWQSFVFNARYGTSFPASSPAGPGKVMGWTDWTHGG